MASISHLAARWRRASLFARFALAGGVVLIANMLVTGSWVAERIAEGVLRQSAINSARFVESILAPLSQDLEETDMLSPGATRALEEVVAAAPLAGRVVSLKIWKKGGLVAFATEPSLIGTRFDPSPELRAAWQGLVAVELDGLGDAESAYEATLGEPLAEIYAPVRAVWSGEVIAVIEFYERATTLSAELAAARRTSWLVVAGATLATGALLAGIVGSGSRTIGRQRALLERQIDELGRLATANRDLRVKVQRASAGAAETSERYLGRIGADLHDGPAQLLSLAALRLDSLEGADRPEARAAEIADLRRAVAAAMSEIRNISRGLSLPELQGQTLGSVIRRAVDIHVALTRTEVALDLPADDPVLPRPQTISVYRFVQEGLSNATRHAGGAGMAVRASTGPGRRVSVCVSDDGPGLPPDLSPAPVAPGKAAGLGLRGLAERIESLGGDFTVTSRPGGGVTLCLSLAQEEDTDLDRS